MRPQAPANRTQRPTPGSAHRRGGPDLHCHAQADHRDHRVRRAEVAQGEQIDSGVQVGDQVARAEQRRDDRAHHDAGHRLVAHDDALEGALHVVALGHPAQTPDPHTIRQRPGHIRSSPRHNYCRAVREAKWRVARTRCSPLRRWGLARSRCSTSIGGRRICGWPTPNTPAPPEARRSDQADW